MRLTSQVKRIAGAVKKAVRRTLKSVISKMSQSNRGGRGSFNTRGGGGGGRGDRGGQTQYSGRGRGDNFQPRGGFSGGYSQSQLDPLSTLSQSFTDVSLGPETDSGKKLHVVTNHFELKWTGSGSGGSSSAADEFTIHSFHVSFTPEDLTPFLKKAIMARVSEIFNGPYIYDGDHQLFCSKKFTEDPLEIASGAGGLDAKNPEDQIKYVLRVDYTRKLPQGDPVYTQIYNLIVRKCLFGMGLDEIGENFYDSEAIVDYPNLKVQLWPGYITSMQTCEKGLLLCVDITHKVVREVDLLTIINAIRSRYEQGPRKSSSLEDFILAEIKGTLLITPYNKKAYRVDGIRMDLNPSSTFKRKDGSEISFLDYFYEKYKLETKDLSQPLVFSNVKVRRGEKKEVQEVVLIPQLCHVTGLTEEMRSNMGIMRELSRHLHLTPKDRVDMLLNFMERLKGSNKCQATLQEWGFQFESKLTSCTMGRVLPSQSVTFANERLFKADDKNDWTKALRSNQMLVSVPLRNWLVIVGERDSEKAQEFFRTMKKVAEPLGFQIDKPMSFELLSDVRVQSYIRNLEQILQAISDPSSQLQMILCILPNNNSDLYNGIKRRLTQDLGILSQCLLSKNLSSKGVMSIATKLVIQMNTKLGGEPWTIKLPPEIEDHSITIGFDMGGGGKGKGYSGGKVGYLVATTNSSYSRYWSTLFHFRGQQEMVLKMGQEIINCLEAYKSFQGRYPAIIFLYRNNVEDGRVTSGEIGEDAKNLNGNLKNWAQSAGLPGGPPHLVYFVMAKRSSTRLMSHAGNCGPSGVEPHQVRNPPPGTVVDEGITPRDGSLKEFYMVPTVARQGTVRAVHYRVILDTKGVEPKVLQAFTYKLCHLYYNWSGTVNLPAVCQYAGKLAKQTGQAMPGGSGPSEKVANYLHFL